MSRRDFTRGTAVTIRLDDGSEVKGSVWAECEEEGQVWVALDDGRYARLRANTGAAQLCDADGRATPVCGTAAA